MGTSVEENIAFIEMSKHFESKGLPIPKFINQSDDNLLYLQEDLAFGAFDYLRKARLTRVYSTEEKEICVKQ